MTTLRLGGGLPACIARLVGLLVLVVAATAGAQGPALRLLGPADATAADAPAAASSGRVLSWRSIKPDVGAMDAAMRRYRANAQADVVLDLVDGVTLNARVIGVDERPTGATLYLRLADVDLGSAVLTLEQGRVHGHVAFPGATYTIEPTAGAGHRVVRDAPHSLRPDRAPRAVVPPPEPKAATRGAAGDPPADSGRLIDVMVVWTKAAELDVGAPTLALRAQSQIDKTNLIYLNSGIAQRVRLVHSGRVPADPGPALDYQERSGACGAYDECALDDLTNTGDGRMDGVHALRTTHGADLVVLYYKEPTVTNVCGLGWMPQPPQANTAIYGFTVVELYCSNDGFTVPHELGHNMGANHDPYVLFGAPDGCADGKEKGAFCYSRGFVNVPDRWYTVMAYFYECDDNAVFCNAIDYFSNPRLTLGGDPLGTATLNNNAHTLNKTAKAVAAYRPTAAALHPVAPLFGDVHPLHPFYGYVQFFGQAAISSGCGNGNFCPDAPVTREAMSAFVMRPVKASNWTPPPATGIFTDVPTNSPFAPWIEALRNAGITSGCSATAYCPTNAVTRGQMAVFLLRASCGAGYTPGARPQAFGDVPPAHPFFAFINKFAALGITSGCGGGNYCPDVPVTRGQMAVFVERSYPFLSPSESCTP